MSLGKTMKWVASAAWAALAVSAAEPSTRPVPAAAAASIPSALSAPSHWAFQPVRDPAPPQVVDAGWCRTPLDRFILATLERQGRKPAPEADRRTWLRRATFDLTGLAPTVEEIDAFERDASPEAFDRVIDRLLASPRHGERWGRHWLDVVRYADTAGETADYPVPVAWRYRNYVIDAFNADKPYFDFVQEQVAGDLLARQGPRERYAERVAATGFLAISRRFGFDSENYHHLTLQDTIDTMGQAFLGLTLGCARCHNHKYDPVPATEYYALYGIFESTRFAFPGSEQKQRTRSMVPLIPPEESLPRWREHEARVASLTRVVQRAGLPVPSAVLRSIDDLDGDFELQAPAAGGSKGVLVPPWVYGGPIAVTTDAQSPLRNRYPGGRVGASIPAGMASWHLGQSLNRLGRPVREASRLSINLDFKVLAEPKAGTSPGRAAHRFWAGRDGGRPAFEVLISAHGVSLRTGPSAPQSTQVPNRTVLGDFAPETWQNLQLEVDRKTRTVLARLGTPGSVRSTGPLRLSADWDGVLDFIGLDSGAGPAEAASAMLPRPGLCLDNLALQPEALAPVSTEVATSHPAADPSVAERDRLETELASLRGIDGGFEAQKADAPPASPWRPGPDSRVRLRTGSQSPFVGFLPRGALGIHMPGGPAYDGFGQSLSPAWKADRTGHLRAAFDFRCGEVPGGVKEAQEGTWRYYLGHGPGTSAAIELFWSGSEFFRIDGDRRYGVAPLRRGRWYQVAIDLDLKARRYEAALREEGGEAVTFAGALAPRWDGSIDDVFIDSYGHRVGPKPALDADNFAVQEAPLPPAGSVASAADPAAAGRRPPRVAALEARLKTLQDEAQSAARELERLLVEGPFPLAYGVSEGTPRDAVVQVRGEPDQPGQRVRRGTLSAVGPARMDPPTSSSGRMELARWLADPANPLPARVMVNRVWQQHFGRGLVATANDFGLRGQAPSHPDLLDHLASKFRRSGGSIKALHRAIVASATYRQRSEPESALPASATSFDASSCPVEPSDAPSAGLVAGRMAPAGASSDGLFSPFARRRLGAEETRDALLEACGELDLSVGEGHPFPSPTRWGYTQHGPYAASYDHQRRSVYLMTQRIQRHPFLALFDGADPNASTAGRRTTTVPSQALFFLNDPLVHRQAERLARSARAAHTGEAAQVDQVFRRILRRPPGPAEAAEATAFLARYRQALGSAAQSMPGSDTGSGPAAETGPEARALAAWVRVLLGSNEFLTID